MLIVKLNFFFKNDKAQHALNVHYLFMLRRFANFFNVKLEFKMHLFKIFFKLCDWFLKNKSGINFLDLKTKLTLICNNANTVFLKVFLQLFLKFSSINILFYPSYLGPTGLIYLQPMLHLRRNQLIDLFSLAKCVESDIKKKRSLAFIITYKVTSLQVFFT